MRCDRVRAKSSSVGGLPRSILCAMVGSGAGCCGCRLEQDVQIVWMNRAELRLFAVDVTIAHQGRKGIFQCERTFFLGDGNFLMQMFDIEQLLLAKFSF